MPSDAARHCMDLVRAADKDRFLAALFAPDAGGESFWPSMPSISSFPGYAKWYRSHNSAKCA